MTHATPEELYDIAYGFRPEEEHLLDCADCARTLRLIAEERAFLRRAMVETPRSSRWARAVPLAAAGALAVGMFWALFRPAPTESPIRMPVQERLEEKFDVERFARELKSPNSLRRAAARQALRAHGGAAVEALRTAGEKELLEEILYPVEEDRALLRRLRETRLSCRFSESSLPDVADLLKDFLGINVLVEDGIEDQKVTIDLADVLAEDALHRILDPLKLRFEAKCGAVFVTSKPKAPPEGFLPLRLPVGAERRREAMERIAELADPSIDKREAAVARLEQLGFAAEEALWSGLDAAQPDVSSACAGLLDHLYRLTVMRLFEDPLREKLRTDRVTLQTPRVSLREFLASFSDSVGVSMILDPRADHDAGLTTTRVADLPALVLLAVTLREHGMAPVTVGNVVFVTKSELMPVHTRWAPQNALWISSEEDAAILGPLFEKSDLEGLRRLGVKAVRFLRFAQSRVDADSAAKYEAVARVILEESPGWFPDEPSGLRRQGGKALDALEALRMDRDFADAPSAEILEFLGKTTELRFEPAAPLPPGPWTLKLKGVRATEMLDLLTRPYGLDYAEENGRIVIDTAPAIRRMVGK